MLIPREDNNALENFKSHEDEKLKLEGQNIERDYRNLIGKSSDIESHIKDNLSGYIL